MSCLRFIRRGLPLWADVVKKRQDGIGDFAAMCLEREVPGVIKTYLSRRDIPLESFGTSGKKEGVILGLP
jgi:hypothetical protein